MQDLAFCYVERRNVADSDHSKPKPSVLLIAISSFCCITFLLL